MSPGELDHRDAAHEERELLARLRDGDEHAFEQLVCRCHSTMLAVAQAHVRSPAGAADVVHEAWLRVIRGLDDFDGRSSLRTWIVRTVVDTASASGGREERAVPAASLAGEGADEPAVDPGRFRGPDDRFPGGWKVFPADWHRLPDEKLNRRRPHDLIASTLASLPPAQRAVIRMRDVEGCSAEEVSAALDLTEAAQRVLLHRARSRVRSVLEAQLP